MKLFIVSLFAALIAFAVPAQAQFAAGFLQGGVATSTSDVSGAGGSGALVIGSATTTTTSASQNVSAAQVTQTPGSTVVITESTSTGGVQSTSSALGLAGAVSGGDYNADGGAIGGGVQGALIVFP